MANAPLMIFARSAIAPPLKAIQNALREEGYPANLGVNIAGEAKETELLSPHWEAAIVRWLEPEMHEVITIVRQVLGTDEEAKEAISDALQFAMKQTDTAGKLIVEDHLGATGVVYEIHLFPALTADDNHPAWEALDVLLRNLARVTEGIILAEEEAFYDSEGEPIILEGDLTYHWDTLEEDSHAD